MIASQRGRREHGFALLIVLWTMVLLALVFTQLVSAGRGEAQLAANLRAEAVAEATADGAAYEAIFRLLDPSPSQWLADGAPHISQAEGGREVVSIADLSGSVNPNTAPPPLLASLLEELGADKTQADSAGEAMVEWRSPDVQGRFGADRYAAAGLPYRPARSGFQSIDEVGLVLGMTPSLLALLAPHLSLANPDNPNPLRADPVVLRAMQAAGIDIAVEAKPEPVRNVMITAAVITRSGARFVRRATVRLGSHALFEILGWDSAVWP